MHVLRQLASTGAGNPQDLLAQEWLASKLPTAPEDPNLWDDAQYVLQRGVAKVQDLAKRGRFVEATSVVASLRVVLPWGFKVQEKYETQFHVVLFSRRSSAVATVLKPVVTGLECSGTKRLVLHSVLSDMVEDAEPARRVDSAKGFQAAVGMVEGRNHPSPGRQCGRCSYATICPSAPSAP